MADIGAGSGLFSRPLAREVTEEGLVFAIDVNPQLLKHIEKTARNEGIGNIRTVLATEQDPGIPELVDLIFICFTLHHIDQPAAYLENLGQYLKPSGRIAIVDFKEDWPSFHRQYSVEGLHGWMSVAGYVQVENHDFPWGALFAIYSVTRPCPCSNRLPADSTSSSGLVYPEAPSARLEIWADTHRSAPTRVGGDPESLLLRWALPPVCRIHRPGV